MYPIKHGKHPCKLTFREQGVALEGLAHVVEVEYHPLLTGWFGCVETADGDGKPLWFLPLLGQRAWLELEDGRIGWVHTSTADGEAQYVAMPDSAPGQRAVIYFQGLDALMVPVARRD